MSARKAACRLLRMRQLISRYAIRRDARRAYPRASAGHKRPGATHLGSGLGTSVGGQSQQPVLHAVAVDPTAEAQRMQRRDVGLGVRVAATDQVRGLLGPVGGVEVDI